MLELAEASYAPSTMVAYKRYWATLVNFIRIQKYPTQLPISQRVLVAFLKSLVERKRAASTIKTMFAAIGTIHKMLDGNDPTKNFLLVRSLKAISKVARPTKRLLPIRRKLLRRLIGKVDLQPVSSFHKKAIKAIFALAYEGCFRIGEIVEATNAQHTLKASNVSFLTNSRPHLLRICLDSYKHSAAPSALLLKKRKDKFCAYRLVKSYMKVRPDREGCFFSEGDARPFARDFIAKILRSCLADLVVNPAAYNTHSFRVGRTTDLVEEGAHESTIQQVGRWKTTAYRAYIRIKDFQMPD